MGAGQWNPAPSPAVGARGGAPQPPTWDPRGGNGVVAVPAPMPPPNGAVVWNANGSGGGGGAKFVAVANVCCACSYADVRFALVPFGGDSRAPLATAQVDCGGASFTVTGRDHASGAMRATIAASRTCCSNTFSLNRLDGMGPSLQVGFPFFSTLCGPVTLRAPATNELWNGVDMSGLCDTCCTGRKTISFNGGKIIYSEDKYVKVQLSQYGSAASCCGALWGFVMTVPNPQVAVLGGAIIDPSALLGVGVAMFLAFRNKSQGE